MATRTVKARVELDGEKQYKNALAELQKGNQVLGSEMKKLQAEYKGNTESTEFLTKKGELLERQLLQQRDKVQTLREALQNAAQQFGESSQKTQDWQIKLNQAEAAQYDLEHAIEENNKAMTQTEDTTQSLSLDVKGLADQFGIKLPGGLDKALTGMKGFSAGSVAAVGAVTAVVAALINAEKQLIELTKETAAQADELLTLSKITGLDTTTIQEMQYAAELIDVSFETIKGSMTKLKRSQDSARDGNKELADTFAKLGVQIVNADGTLRDSEAVFYDVIDALGAIDSSTERDAVAMEIFGRSAEDLNPLILEGSGALKAYAEEAENVNYILSGESLEALAEVDDAYQRMQQTQESVKKQMAVEMAPAVEELYTAWTEFMLEAGQALVDSGIIDGLAEILKAVAGLLQPMEEINDDLIPGATSGLTGLKPILSMIGALLASIADAIDVITSANITGILNGDLWNALGLNYGKGSANHYQTWKMQQEGTYEQYVSYYSQKSANASAREGRTRNSGMAGGFGDGADYSNAFYSNGKWYDKDTGWEIPGYATGVSRFAGGLALVGENGPELVGLPEGSQIWSAQESRGGGGDVFNITIPAKDIKEFNDIIRIAQDARIMARMGG